MFLLSLILVISVFSNAAVVDSTVNDLSQQHPYVVSIKVKGKHVCSGTMVMNRCVITSARCVKRCMRGSTVAYGNGTEIKVKLAVPNENLFFNQYDAGIIALYQDFPVKERVALASLNDTLQRGQPAEVLSYEGDRLTKYSVIVNTTSECHQDYGKYFFPHTEFCATTNQVSSACFVDFGAPLIQNNKLFGLASFCIRPHKATLSTVFAKFPISYMNSPTIEALMNLTQFC